MPHDSRPSGRKPIVLATDLDGTLIPLSGSEQNRVDLKRLSDRLADSSVTLAFVTGRHLAIVEEVIAEHGLPHPDWIICNVGTAIYYESSGGWRTSVEYQDHLAAICEPLPITEVRHHLAMFEGLSLQEDEKQSRFKLSFYVDQAELDAISSQIEQWLTDRDAPYSLIRSVDPFTGDGLIDLLPQGVSKAYAVEWWRQHCGFEREEIVFAGDSGNDLAALTAGYLSIVVSNADRAMISQVIEHHQQQGDSDMLHLADNPATSGLLEGCRAFGLFADRSPQTDRTS